MAPTTSASAHVEGLSQLPQFYGNGTQSGNNLFNSKAAPAASICAGMGANRTLVLLNGRRMISRDGLWRRGHHQLP